jgi:hypothetical protein
MRFSNWRFPASATPEHDGTMIHEAPQEVELCDQLGFATLWPAEQVVPAPGQPGHTKEAL